MGDLGSRLDDIKIDKSVSSNSNQLLDCARWEKLVGAGWAGQVDIAPGIFYIQIIA